MACLACRACRAGVHLSAARSFSCSPSRSSDQMTACTAKRMCSRLPRQAVPSSYELHSRGGKNPHAVVTRDTTFQLLGLEGNKSCCCGDMSAGRSLLVLQPGTCSARATMHRLEQLVHDRQSRAATPLENCSELAKQGPTGSRTSRVFRAMVRLPADLI